MYHKKKGKSLAQYSDGSESAFSDAVKAAGRLLADSLRLRLWALWSRDYVEEFVSRITYLISGWIPWL